MTTESIKAALKGQYHAALEMLREPIAACPDELWQAGRHPRQFWRLAHHTLFFAHLYSEQNSEAFVLWTKERDPISYDLESPDDPTPFSKEELLAYWDHIDQTIDEKLDRLDLDHPDSGFPWYPNFPKFDHQLLSIRHIQEHAGQLRDRIMDAGLDPAWIGRGRRRTG